MRRRSSAHGCVAIASLHVGNTGCIAPAHLVAVLGALCTSSWSLSLGRYRRFSSIGNGRYGTSSSRSETSLNDKTSAIVARRCDHRPAAAIASFAAVRPRNGLHGSFAAVGREQATLSSELPLPIACAHCGFADSIRQCHIGVYRRIGTRGLVRSWQSLWSFSPRLSVPSRRRQPLLSAPPVTP